MCGGAAGDGVADGVVAVGVDEAGLAGLAEITKGVAQFLGLREIDSAIAKGDEDALDVFVIARLVDAIDDGAEGHGAVIAKDGEGGWLLDNGAAGEIKKGETRLFRVGLLHLLDAFDQLAGRGQFVGGLFGFLLGIDGR